MTEAPAAPERTIPGLTPALKRRLRTLFGLLNAFSPALTATLAMRMMTRPRRRPFEPGEIAFLAAARTRWLSTANGRVRIYEWPRQEAATDAPRVLIVHGWRSHTARLRQIIEALQARGLRVLAFDAPGHGHSSGHRLDLETYRATIAAVARECGPVMGIVAHSFGALTTMSWLADGHETAPLRAAALISAPGGVDYLFDTFTAVMGLQPAVVQRMRALFRRRYGRDPGGYRSEEMARRIELPVLLVHGGADELIPAAHSEDIAGEFKTSQLHVFPSLSHGAPLRDANTVPLVADFMADHLKACHP